MNRSTASNMCITLNWLQTAVSDHSIELSLKLLSFFVLWRVFSFLLFLWSEFICSVFEPVCTVQLKLAFVRQSEIEERRKIGATEKKRFECTKNEYKRKYKENKRTVSVFLTATSRVNWIKWRYFVLMATLLRYPSFVLLHRSFFCVCSFPYSVHEAHEWFLIFAKNFAIDLHFSDCAFHSVQCLNIVEMCEQKGLWRCDDGLHLSMLFNRSLRSRFRWTMS